MPAIQARTEFASALNQVCAERGIDPEVVLDTIRAAIEAAFRKDYPEIYKDIEENELELKIDVDTETGQTTVLKVDGDEKEDITPPGFGRIAAQTAKQVILQRVREAEKDAIIHEYEERIGEMITGMVLRFDGKNVIFDIGRGQAYMPPEEQIKGEFYKMNQRMAVYIEDIRETMRGRTIIVSRSTPELVKALFSREVPEVNSGAVEIVNIAREAGIRTKMAVDSTQSGVDPVGSCVGQKGVRVQEVINELNNEKIDIIQYSEDIDQFIAAALAPAENLDIEIDEDKKKAVVTVPDDQLSLAIGRGGQNVRLAAKLTGYKIDIEGGEGKGISVTGEEEYELDQLDLPEEVREILIEENITTIDYLQRRLNNLVKDVEAVTKDHVQTITEALETFRKATTQDPKPQTDEADEDAKEADESDDTEDTTDQETASEDQDEDEDEDDDDKAEVEAEDEDDEEDGEEEEENQEETDDEAEKKDASSGSDDSDDDDDDDENDSDDEDESDTDSDTEVTSEKSD